MVRSAFVLVPLALLGLVSPRIQTETQPKYRVLLIGYTKADTKVKDVYQPFELVGNLDVERMKSVLVTNFNVPESDITCVTDPTELHKDKIRALAHKVLVEGIQPDDIVVLYYSGHGATYADASKTTGESQALLMADTGFVKDANGKTVLNDLGQGALDPRQMWTGPEIRSLIGELADHHVRNVTLIIDSCHAGGATRSTDGFVEKGVDALCARMDGQNGLDGSVATAVKDNGYVALLSCRESEKAFAIKGRGSVFTMALARALQERSFSNCDDLMREAGYYASSEPTPLQLPIYEGNPKQSVLGQTYKPAPRSFGLQNLDGKLYLKAGSIIGIQNGYTIGLYPKDATNFEGPPRATLVVKDAQSSLSELAWKARSGVAEQDLPKMKAVVVDGIGHELTRVYIDAALKPTMPADLALSAASNRYVSFVEQSRDSTFMIALTSDNERAIFDQNRVVLDTFDHDWKNRDGKSLAERLRQVAQARCVLALKPTQPGPFKAELMLVPADADANGYATAVHWDKRLDPAGVTDGDTYCWAVKVTPTGIGVCPKTVYASLLSVGTNVESSMVFPDDSKDDVLQPGLTVLPANGNWYVLCSDGYKPKGSLDKVFAFKSHTFGGGPVEIEKVFVTSEFEDFRPLSSGVTRGPVQTELGAAILAFSSGVSREAKAASGNSSWAVAEFAIRPLDPQKSK